MDSPLINRPASPQVAISTETREKANKLTAAAVRYIPEKDTSTSPDFTDLGDMDITQTDGEPGIDLSQALMYKTAKMASEDLCPILEEIEKLDQLLAKLGLDWAYSHDEDVQAGRKVVANKLQLPLDAEQTGVLVLESSGGGGHIAVASKVIGDLEAEGGKTSGEHQSIYRKNVMEDFLGKRMTDATVGPWNKAVREGDTAKQRTILKIRRVGEMIGYLPFFLGTFFTLMGMKTPPKKVISTQPLGLGAILKAVASYNKIMAVRHTNWTPVVVEQKLTDLLTPKAIHFVDPIKSLSKGQRKNLKLMIPGSERDFAQPVKDLLGTGFKEVDYTGDAGLPVNKLFLSDELEAFKPGTSVNIPLNSLSKSQVSILKGVPHLEETLETPEMENKEKELVSIPISIGEKDTLHQLMMGSMPPEPNVMHFVAASVFLASCAEARGNQHPENHHLRVLCGRDRDGEPSLFKTTCAALKEWGAVGNDGGASIPQWLKICPLPFQHPTNIAKGGMRADKYFTRGGGATAMEHMAMARLKPKNADGTSPISIVSDGTMGDEQDVDKLIDDDFPLVWEGGNARFLQNTLGANITNRHKFLADLSESYLGQGESLTQKEMEGYNAFLENFTNVWKSHSAKA